MINIAKLKQKILYDAISGKLSNCFFPDDFEYYSMIIKESSSRKNKVLPIENEDIPFELPEHWKWIQIGLLGEMGMGQTILSTDLDNIGDPVYSATMADDYFGFISSSKNRIKLLKGDIVIPARGNSIGYLKSVIDDNSTCTQTTMYIKLSNNIYKKWIYYSLLARRKDLFEHGGMAIPQITIGVIRNELIPIPPLKEQKIIVEKLDKIFIELNKIDLYQKKISLIKEKIESKIFMLAMQGRLVKQIETEGNGNDLLESINAEKLRLQKEKKIKLEKKYPSIALEEIPFDIPHSWKWVRLCDLCLIPITDGTHQTPTYSIKEDGIPFISSKDVTSKRINWDNIKYITKDLHKELYKRIAPQKDDVLLAKNGTTGIAALVEDDRIFDIYVTLAVLRPVKKYVYPKFLLYLVNSPICKNQFNSHLIGIGVPNLHLNVIKEVVVPLPPYEEQKRIVAKIDELLNLLV